MQDTTRDPSASAVHVHDARQVERAYRALELSVMASGTQWLFVAALLAQRTGIPLAVDVLVGVLGVIVTAGLVAFFRRQSRARLSSFVDPMTGELSLPGERLPLPRRSLASCAAVPFCEVVLLLLH